MAKSTINYQQFLEGYRIGIITVLVNKSKAGNFVMSKFGSKYNKPAHLFWTWLAIIMIIPLPIIFLIFKTWVHAFGILIIGLLIRDSARKSATQFVLTNMLENEDFWDFILLHKGATLKDTEGNAITSEFLDRMTENNTSTTA